MQYTINEILSLQKMVRERVNELRGLRASVSNRDTYFGEYAQAKQRVQEPQYDVIEVDTRITQLELWLFKVDAAIKQSNAVTKLETEINVESLLQPLAVKKQA